MANYNNLRQAINETITQNGVGAITGPILNQVLQAMINALGDGYQFVGVANPSTNPGTYDYNVFYLAWQGGTYTNFGGLQLNRGFNILRYDGTWHVDELVQQENEILPNSQNLPTTGAVFERFKLDGGAYDVSEHNNNMTFADLASILSSQQLTTLIPTDIRHGGMSIKFIRTTDNKYVQARCMPQNFTTDVTQWQGVDDVPTAVSPNIVESGGTYKEISNLNSEINGSTLVQTYDNAYYHKTNHEIVTNVSGWCINSYSVKEGQVYICSGKQGTNGAGIVFLDSGGNYLSQIDYGVQQTFENEEITIPQNCAILYVGGGTTNDKPTAELKTELPNSLNKRIDRLNNEVKNVGKIKILLFGNSFTEDSFGYAPFILKNINPNIELTVCIMYYGGCNLQQHYLFIINDSAVYTRHLYTNDASAWVSTSNIKASDVLADDWDYIFFQQQSTKSDDYATYQPYLNNIITHILSIKKNVKFGWNLTHAIYNVLQDSADMFEDILTAVNSVKEETLVNFYNPYGTAVQNARTTTLQSLGDGGNLLYDTHHLQEGLPCLLANYVSVMTIFELLGAKDNIFGDTTSPDNSWTTTRNVPGRHGSSIGLTTENIKIAQKCAYMAFKKPFAVTDCSVL